MRWEELTTEEFPAAVEKAEGVCLLPLSCLEGHSRHLPLGTDLYIARELCQRAAALEPALIFYDYIFTQILEAQHRPGTIAIDADVFVRLLDNTCREIARNGLKKIVFVNAHGGNNFLLNYFLQIQLESPRDYVVYFAQPPLAPEDAAALEAQQETAIDGHAGEVETSLILAAQPHLVHQDRLTVPDEGMPLGRLDTLRKVGVSTGIWWYADYPNHYQGDGRAGTAEKGEVIFNARAQALANAVRVIKADGEAKRLQDEFYAASRK